MSASTGLSSTHSENCTASISAIIGVLKSAMNVQDDDKSNLQKDVQL